jgi:hypothetical protein
VKQVVGAEAVLGSVPQRQFLELGFQFLQRQWKRPEERRLNQIRLKSCLSSRRLLRSDPRLSPNLAGEYVELKGVDGLKTVDPGYGETVKVFMIIMSDNLSLLNLCVNARFSPQIANRKSKIP